MAIKNKKKKPSVAASPNPVKMRRSLEQWVDKLRERYKNGQCDPSSHYLLPLLSVRNDPMTLKDHFMFKPMFRFPRHKFRPKRVLYKTARQVGKTHSLCGSDTLNCQFTNHWRSLFVTPLYEQIKKISTEVVRPMISDSPFKDILLDKNSKTGVLSKSYRTGGVQFFSYAYLDSMRIRSISGVDCCNIDEIQHILKEHIPVILETMSARPQTSFVNYTGTPLSFANPIEDLWRRSTMCEWVIKCRRCNYYNIPNTSHDLYDMIGECTVVCAKCKRPLDPRNGCWLSPVIKNPKELEECLHEGFAGYHISQVIHPLHYNYPEQWRSLRHKMLSNEYSTARFVNEVCGESYDSADRMLTVDELAAACCGNSNDIDSALKERPKLELSAIGVDWGGGGEETPSYTKIAVGGCRPGKLEVETLYVETLPKHWPTGQQVQRVMDLFKIFRPDIFAHDYQGMGHVYEPWLLDIGIPQSRLWSIAYVTTPTKPVMYYNDPTEGNRDCINLDRARSLSALFNMLKAVRIRLPAWDSMQLESDPNKREVDDFLAMHGEEIRRPGGHNVYTIQTDPNYPDDLVHAVNFMCAACWFRRGSFPEMGNMLNNHLTEEELMGIFPEAEKSWTA